MSIINGWITPQVDFVMVFPQADIEFDMYMEITQGTETKEGSRTTQLLELLNTNVKLYSLSTLTMAYFPLQVT